MRAIGKVGIGMICLAVAGAADAGALATSHGTDGVVAAVAVGLLLVAMLAGRRPSRGIVLN